MAPSFAWKASTLAKARTIAAEGDPQRWLSLSGRNTLKVIDALVLPGAALRPSRDQVLAEVVKIGAEPKWDMPNMPSAQKKAFMRWLIDTRMEQLGS